MCLPDLPAGPKLFKEDGSNYPGDSNQTLEQVVLMSFFAHEALSGIEAFDTILHPLLR